VVAFTEPLSAIRYGTAPIAMGSLVRSGPIQHCYRRAKPSTRTRQRKCVLPRPLEGVLHPRSRPTGQHGFNHAAALVLVSDFVVGGRRRGSNNRVGGHGRFAEMTGANCLGLGILIKERVV
jgi:hypothetical protein